MNSSNETNVVENQSHAPPVKALAILLAMAAATAVGGLITTSAMSRAIAEREKNPPKPAAAELKTALIVPEFSLTERSERKITLADFKGRVGVFGFVFTNCPSTCKMVTGVMARLRSQLPPQIQMTSITVDPIHDTPAVLREYADQQKADANTWWFLTGKRNEVYDLIRNGFKLSVEENAMIKRPMDEPITHSSRLAVVDKQGRIRGYFETSDPAAVDALVRLATKLMHEAD